MITKITGEQPFQVLTNNFSISPSQEGYTLQISADGSNYSDLFAVSAGQTRMVSNVAANSFYRLKGNNSEVTVNWLKTCVTEGGGGDLSNYYTKDETDAEIAQAVSGISLDGYYTSAQTQTAIGSAITPLEAQIQEISGATPQIDLSDYYTSAQTEDAISAATSGKADAANVTENQSNLLFPKWNQQGVITGSMFPQAFAREQRINGSKYGILGVGASGPLPTLYAPTTSGNPGEILVSTGDGAPVWSAVTMGGNSPIIPAITTQAEYEAISGDVKTGDLIQVNNVDINGDNNPQYGLFEATVDEEESDGVVRKFISWSRMDSSNSVFWAYEVYPWMVESGITPVDFLSGSFLIAVDMTAAQMGEDEYNGIGFNEDGKPVITHIAPAYDDEVGGITGITREDTPIGGGADMSAYYTSAQTEDAISAATSGKADAANLSPADTNHGDLYFPKWNEQGIITGKTGLRNFQIRFDINGIQNRVTSPDTGYIPSIYAPSNAGTAGDILVSTGNGAPVWSAVTIPDASDLDDLAAELSEAERVTAVSINDIRDKMVTSMDVKTIVKMSQASYDALSTKDATTLYIITGTTI